jgi:hypothetical protein
MNWFHHLDIDSSPVHLALQMILLLGHSGCLSHCLSVSSRFVFTDLNAIRRLHAACAARAVPLRKRENPVSRQQSDVTTPGGECRKLISPCLTCNPEDPVVNETAKYTNARGDAQILHSIVLLRGSQSTQFANHFGKSTYFILG